MEESLFKNLDIEISTASLPNYIAVEGPIGVGKTTLAKIIDQGVISKQIGKESISRTVLQRP